MGSCVCNDPYHKGEPCGVIGSLRGKGLCWYCVKYPHPTGVEAETITPSPLEVATKALEEIAARGGLVDDDPGFMCPVCRKYYRGFSDNPVCNVSTCPTVIASRALATIRGGEKTAETTKEAPDV